MSRRPIDTCASCKDYPLAQAAVDGGVAECPWWGRKAFNDRACVLHNPAKDREHRKRYVIQLMQQNNEKG